MRPMGFRGMERALINIRVPKICVEQPPLPGIGHSDTLPVGQYVSKMMVLYNLELRSKSLKNIHTL